jgi:hypothetical protein
MNGPGGSASRQGRPRCRGRAAAVVGPAAYTRVLWLPSGLAVLRDRIIRTSDCSSFSLDSLALVV